jgi:virulence-associated protein VagC
MPAIAKVFTIGKSQAIRLSKDFRVHARELRISKNATTGGVKLRPKPESDGLQALIVQPQQLQHIAEFTHSREDVSAGFASRANVRAFGYPRLRSVKDLDLR